MATTRAQLAARLAAAERARGVFRIPFRTAAGRVFTLDVGDVLSIALDCLTWMHTEDAEQPRGRIVEQLATAVLDEDQGLIGNTAIVAARQVVQGVRS
ncbi:MULTISPECIES: hypothetical protein [Streptomyces rochei group]|uniref:hypothetical protein n=1 Tax=Streptomyces rochei group TaxID=2867164 RepID=UPI00187666FE|nr:hypothetical protein [Streptomyces vinaceusdrappus]GHC27005.1 hypothetical protein GCM10010308_49890 [Streptomyces vinaceusdrappus]